MKGNFAYILIIIVILTGSIGLYGNPGEGGIEDYLVRTWTIEDNLPQNSILCLLQARDGYIWFGTGSGLVRFRWNTPVLRVDSILSLYEDEDGTLWLGTDGGGLIQYKDGIWESYTTTQGLSNNHVRVINRDKTGGLWVGHRGADRQAEACAL